MKAFLKRVIHLFPATSNAWWHWHVFPRQRAACRGFYPTWQAAADAAQGRHRLRRTTEVVTFRAPEGPQIHSLPERDYPIVFYMQGLLRPETRVLNIGGSLAKEYDGYRALIPFPDGLQWHICDVPEVVAAGQEMLKAGAYPGLSFGTKIEGRPDILLICGALQYLQPTLPEILAGLDRRPDHVFISRTPMQDRVARFYTVQNIGSGTVPYRIDNETAFLGEMESAGYRLVDAWRDGRQLVVPYHQAGNVDGYLGFYFKRA